MHIQLASGGWQSQLHPYKQIWSGIELKGSLVPEVLAYDEASASSTSFQCDSQTTRHYIHFDADVSYLCCACLITDGYHDEVQGLALPKHGTKVSEECCAQIRGKTASSNKSYQYPLKFTSLHMEMPWSVSALTC